MKHYCSVKMGVNAEWWNSIVQIFPVDYIMKFQPEGVKKWLNERMV